MLQIALSLRYVMLIASLGSALGALVMFYEGAGHVVSAAFSAARGAEPKSVIAEVMYGTDAFLFGIVLVIFAYAITFGFVFNLTEKQRERLPNWMRATGMQELKVTLIGAILVYLIVDFSTDWAQNLGETSWVVLTKPISILLIAAATRLFVFSRPPERKTD